MKIALFIPCFISSNYPEVGNRPEFNTVRYAVLMTGPSATADIEGSLVYNTKRGSSEANTWPVSATASPVIPPLTVANPWRVA